MNKCTDITKKDLTVKICRVFFVAADPGFEPGQNESESLVLPLHKSAM